MPTATGAGPERPASTTSAWYTGRGRHITHPPTVHRDRVGHVTLWLLSTDNLTYADELEPLLRIIALVANELSAPYKRWRVIAVGSPPESTGRAHKAAEERTADRSGLVVNIAVGYGGRREIADAVRSLLQQHAAAGTSIEELAEVLDVHHIAEHLYTAGQPHPVSW